MIKQNKVIDKIVKKLINNKFNKSDIFKFIGIKNNFNDFNEYIYFLYKIGLQIKNNYDFITDKYFQMCKSIKSYINYLINDLNITYDFSYFILNKKTNIYQLTFFDILFKNNKFLYKSKNDEYLLFLNDNQFELIDNSIINIELINNNDYLETLLKINNIFVFKITNNNQFEYINSFYPIEESFILKENSAFKKSIIFSTIKNCDLKNFKNTIINNQQSYLLEMKNIINNIYKNTKLDLLLINQFDCLCSFANYLFTNLVKHNFLDNKLTYLKNIFNIKLSINNLIPYVSKINEEQLVFLTNNFNLLTGFNIASDYLNNVYWVIDNPSINDVYKIKLFESKTNDPLSIDINKKIFNTINKKTQLFLFSKKDNFFLYLGAYRVEQLIKINNEYYFKIIKTNLKDFLTHSIYQNNLISDNEYINSFNKLLAIENKQIVFNSVKINYLNSLNKKYDWIKNEILSKLNKNDIYALNKLLLEINFLINKIYLLDVDFLKNTSLINIVNILYEYKKNKVISDKIYIDSTKEEFYDLLLKLSNSSSSKNNN